MTAQRGLCRAASLGISISYGRLVCWGGVETNTGHPEEPRLVDLALIVVCDGFVEACECFTAELDDMTPRRSVG